MIFEPQAADRKVRVFSLSQSFLDQFKGRQPKWGFGGLGYFTYKRTYARDLPDGTTEEWWQTCQRVVEGCFNIQKIHCRQMGLPWKEDKAQGSAQDMFQRMWDFKFTPPGRGLWVMGTDLVYDRGSAALQNCAFVSTDLIGEDFAAPFCFLMDMSMLGVGVGGDTRGAGKVRIITPRLTDEPYVVADSREGWVDLLRTVLNSFVGKNAFPTVIDYSKVRGRGTPIKTFGGIASGPKPLHLLIEGVTNLLLPKGITAKWEVAWQDNQGRIEKAKANFSGSGDPFRITSTHIVDVFNYVGRCVVAGGVRRTAEIMFGEPEDTDFLTLKQDQEALNDRRWASNNSVFARVGMDYSVIVDSVSVNGEPGIMWLDNSRAFGRMADPPDYKDRRIMGTNPCGEQPLESFELCVSGDTPIQMHDGVALIESRVGVPVRVWNGDGWSEVVPRVTGHDRELFRVTLSDGSHLDCTANHGWHVLPEGERVFRRVETKDLVRGSQVVPFEIDAPIEGVFNPVAFEMGLFTGDGFINRTQGYAYPVVTVCGEKARLRDLDVQGVWWKSQTLEGYTDPVNRLSLHGLLSIEEAEVLNDKGRGLTSAVFSMSRASILDFVAGWIEADGSVTNAGGPAEGYRIYGSEPKMRDLQVLLRRVGINHATIRLFEDAGAETNFGVRNYALWYCQIPSFECGEIPTRIKRAQNIGSRTARNNAHPNGNIDRARKQKVVRVERLPGLHTTYCFDEPENHMAVFGNVLTYQCNLVETYPAHHDTYEDFERTLKMAYLYAKTVTLVPTHDPRANAVMTRNRRIGCSMSGITQAIKKLGRREFLNWCDKGYGYIESMDQIYSDWLGVPLSIKKTSVKPSGTVSLLCGATPGIHYPHSEYYIRWVRVANTSPLVQACVNAGYEVHPDPYADDTSVVGFPVHEENFSKGKDHVTVWEQFANAVDMQKHWADNQVSVTITFRPDEKADLKTCLEVFETSLKGLSMLPAGDEKEHGYRFPPYQAIDRDQYESLMSRISPLNFSTPTHDSASEDRFCSNDSCMVRLPDTQK